MTWFRRILGLTGFRSVKRDVPPCLAWQVILNSGESILEALDIEARFQISFWDALVIQAAQASGAEVLYSEDLSDRQAYEAVRVINPLRAAV